MNSVSRWVQSVLRKESGYCTRGMWVWSHHFFGDFLTSVMIHKTTIMGKLGMNPKKNSEKNAERSHHFLASEKFLKLPQYVERRCFTLLGTVSNDEYICLDEVDVAKPCAKTMEWLSLVRDSSEWTIVNGYMFHWASIRWIPVILEHEDLDVYTKNQIWRGMIERIVKHVGKIPKEENGVKNEYAGNTKGIFLMDAYYEIASYLDFLQEKKCSFIIRARRDRIWIDAKTGEERRIEDFSPWVHVVRLPWKHYKLFLHVKQYEWFEKPLRVITNRVTWTKNGDPFHACDLYFQRWEIERVFKTMKQEFQLEKIRVQSLTILKNTFAVIQLAMALANTFFNSDTQQKNTIIKGTTFFKAGTSFQKHFDIYVRRRWLTMNRNSIVSFISFSLERFYKRPPKYHLKSINRNPADSAQQRLFTVMGLRESGWV